MFLGRVEGVELELVKVTLFEKGCLTKFGVDLFSPLLANDTELGDTVVLFSLFSFDDTRLMLIPANPENLFKDLGWEILFPMGFNDTALTGNLWTPIFCVEASFSLLSALDFVQTP